jgi:hypothetical protein
MRIDHILKIACQDPFPDEASLLLEKLEQLNCMFSSCRLTTSRWSVRGPYPYNVLLEVLGWWQRFGQDPIPVLVEEPAWYLSH